MPAPPPHRRRSAQPVVDGVDRGEAESAESPEQQRRPPERAHVCWFDSPAFSLTFLKPPDCSTGRGRQGTNCDYRSIDLRLSCIHAATCPLGPEPGGRLREVFATEQTLQKNPQCWPRQWRRPLFSPRLLRRRPATGTKASTPGVSTTRWVAPSFPQQESRKFGAVQTRGQRPARVTLLAPDTQPATACYGARRTRPQRHVSPPRRLLSSP